MVYLHGRIEQVAARLGVGAVLVSISRGDCAVPRPSPEKWSWHDVRLVTGQRCGRLTPGLSNYGIPGIVLMEARAAVVEELEGVQP